MKFLSTPGLDKDDKHANYDSKNGCQHGIACFHPIGDGVGWLFCPFLLPIASKSYSPMDGTSCAMCAV